MGDMGEKWLNGCHLMVNSSASFDWIFNFVAFLDRGEDENKKTCLIV